MMPTEREKEVISNIEALTAVQRGEALRDPLGSETFKRLVKAGAIEQVASFVRANLVAIATAMQRRVADANSELAMRKNDPSRRIN